MGEKSDKKDDISHVHWKCGNTPFYKWIKQADELKEQGDSYDINNSSCLTENRIERSKMCENLSRYYTSYYLKLVHLGEGVRGLKSHKVCFFYLLYSI